MKRPGKVFPVTLQTASLAAPPYLVAPHQAQVTQRLAALRDLSGALVRDVLTPAGVHRLDGAAVLADGYQSCGHMGGGADGEKVLA